MTARETSVLAALVDAVRRAIDELRRSGDGARFHDLVTSWTALDAQLEPAPAPATRSCPACGRTIRAAATLCGYCWTKLSPAP